MSENTQEVKNMLRTFELLTKAITISPNTKEYNDIKKQMTKEEKVVLKHLQQARSLERHNANKQNGCAKKVPRTKKQKTEVEQSLNNTQAFTERANDQEQTNKPTDEKLTTKQHIHDSAFDLNHVLVADLNENHVDNTLVNDINMTVDTNTDTWAEHNGMTTMSENP
jgi:hypothetical protein